MKSFLLCISQAALLPALALTVTSHKLADARVRSCSKPAIHGRFRARSSSTRAAQRAPHRCSESLLKSRFESGILPSLTGTCEKSRLALSAAGPDSRWLVYYSNQAPLEQFQPYDLIVFDSDMHPPLRLVQDGSKRLLGYLSLGEVNQQRSYFSELKNEGLLLQENETWKGSFMIDLRDERWGRRVVEDLIPAVLHQGFDGIFIDTIDNAAYLEQKDSTRFAGMRSAAVRLIRLIREHYPEMPVMLNRGYDLLPEVAGSISMVLAESLYAHYDFAAKVSKPAPADVYQNQVALLKRIAASNPNVTIYTLDYWDPRDAEGIARIYAAQRGNGFRPYVATISLTEIVPEPAR